MGSLPVTTGMGRIVDRAHVLPLRVYYADTDAGGVVYHAKYLEFAERARTEMLRCVGTEHHRLMAASGVAFAVRHCAVDFLKPARLDDCIEVWTRLQALGGASMRARQVITRDGCDLARLEVRVACVDGHGRAARLPQGLREALAMFICADAATPRTAL